MSNYLIQNKNNLPQTIEQKLKEIMATPAEKTTFIQDGDTIKIQKITENGIINVEAKSYPNGRSISEFNVDKPDKKKDLEHTIKQMSSEGYSNKDIAQILAISPSYVSKLNNK